MLKFFKQMPFVFQAGVVFGAAVFLFSTVGFFVVLIKSGLTYAAGFLGFIFTGMLLAYTSVLQALLEETWGFLGRLGDEDSEL